MRSFIVFFLALGLSSVSAGCASCVTDEGTYYIAAHPTRDPGERPIDITNTTHPLLVSMRDAIRDAEPGDDELIVYEGDKAGENERTKALADLSLDIHGDQRYSTVVVDATPYSLGFLHTDQEC